MPLENNISQFIEYNFDALVSHRRWFHQHPETAYKEFQTSNYIKDYLVKIGITNIKTIGGTGVICEIGESGLIHGARFNMDGLPITEANQISFCSLFKGFSHSCGHDFELACGLMTAKYFQENKPNATIRLIFQPAEEGSGEEIHGKTGGQILAEQGVFNIASVMSLHLEPEVPLGTISIIDGEVTCSAYDFDFILHGKTCHAAKPHQGINPIPIAAKLIDDIYSLQEKIKTEIWDDEGYVMITTSNYSTRLELDKADKEETINTIPEYGILKGISRVRSKFVKEKLIEGLKGLELKYKSFLRDCKLQIRQVAVATINNRWCVDNAIITAKNHDLNVISNRTSWRDDAGWASEKAPTAHGFIGIDDGVPTSLHSPTFNPNEKALKVGLNMFIGTLERNCNTFIKL
jgi:metal-dependent amidase/aminoacylase/carboxypeptidase family protein